MRLFIAIEPDEKIRNALCGVMDELKKSGARGNFSRRENLHLTLVFLGEIAPDRLGQVRAAMDAARLEPFTLTLAAPGRFKREGGDILWYGAEGGDTLLSLRRSLTDELIRRGLSPDEKPFRPHLTLARGASGAPRIPEDARGASQRTTAVALMKSERVSGRLVYSKLYERHADGTD